MSSSSEKGVHAEEQGEASSGSGTETQSTSKRMKTSSSMSVEMEEMSVLRRHILSCENVRRNSPAMTAVLSALEKEVVRMKRDAKLRSMFSKTSTSVSSGTSTSVSSGDAVMVDKSCLASTAAAEELDEEEWQDVGDSDAAGGVSACCAVKASASLSLSSEEHKEHGHGGVLGQRLAEASIAGLAASAVKASSPLALVALAIHSALRSDILNFKCTGIPPDQPQAKAAGFAPPIRELPRTTFLPHHWDQHATTILTHHSTLTSLGHVAIRYRKDGLGSLQLRLSILPHNYTHPDTPIDLGSTIPTSNNNSNRPKSWSWEQIKPTQLERLTLKVQFGDLTKEHTTLTLPLGRHVNVASLAAALASERKAAKLTTTAKVAVPPALHYKALSAFMAMFVDAYDVGHVKEPQDTNGQNITQQNDSSFPSTLPATTPLSTTTTTTITPPCRTAAASASSSTNERVPASVGTNDVLPGGHLPPPVGFSPHHGDFEGDLTPSALLDPSLLGNGTAAGGAHGNLMGPNHPCFHPRHLDDDEDKYYTSNNDDDYYISNNDPLRINRGPRRGGGGMMPSPGGFLYPRFDPYGPPGGPMEIHPPSGIGRGRGRFSNTGRLGAGRGGRGGRGMRFPPGGTGNPNPDHMRPPNNDMYL